MNPDVEPIRVPREIVNADSVYLVAWSVADGMHVEAGTTICEIETSKALEEIETQRGGYIRHCVLVGDEVPVGGILGYITDRPDTPLPEAAEAIGAAALPIDARISAKARRKMEELGIDPSQFSGHGVVRERDVVELSERLHEATANDPRGPYRLEPLGTIQRRVARVMEQTVASIPVSTLERIIDLAPVRGRARALASNAKAVITEVDLLVAAVAHACTAFPRFNGFVTADHQMHLFENANVGVAVDVEGDLYLVTVMDAGSKSAGEIAKELRGLQYLAARRRLSAAQVAGGTITVTSMLGRGVHRFQPIPYPHQAAIVGLSDCEPGTTRCMLTLVFDHRVANGSQAAAFLAAIDSHLRQ